MMKFADGWRGGFVPDTAAVVRGSEPDFFGFIASTAPDVLPDGGHKRNPRPQRNDSVAANAVTERSLQRLIEAGRSAYELSPDQVREFTRLVVPADQETHQHYLDRMRREIHRRAMRSSWCTAYLRFLNEHLLPTEPELANKLYEMYRNHTRQSVAGDLAYMHHWDELYTYGFTRPE